MQQSFNLDLLIKHPAIITGDPRQPVLEDGAIGIVH